MFDTHAIARWPTGAGLSSEPADAVTDSYMRSPNTARQVTPERAGGSLIEAKVTNEQGYLVVVNHGETEEEALD